MLITLTRVAIVIVVMIWCFVLGVAGFLLTEFLLMKRLLS